MRRTKEFCQWLVSLAFAFFLVNMLCFFYERPTGWFDTPNGPSLAGWRPGSVLVHGTEGYGITRVDENGYLNPQGKLEGSYILMMGSSHTQGKEVPSNQKYSVLVNDHFAEGTDMLRTYNIACDGNFLPSIIQHFQAAVQAFPDSQMVTIEIAGTDFSEATLKNALSQVTLDAENSVASQNRNAGLKKRISNLVKEGFPLLSLMKSKWKTAVAQQTAAEPQTVDAAAYAALLNQAMALIRSEYDQPIVIIYHPAVSLKADGTVNIKYGSMWSEFQNACASNSIDVINMGPIFEQWYYEHRQLPYGFCNTAPGTGHLNKVGHQLIADTLIAYIERKTV